MNLGHEATVKRLTRIMARTTTDDRERGAAWYRREAEWLLGQWAELTDQTEDPRNVLSVYAALSPQMPWRRNRMLTQMVLRGETAFPGGVFQRSWERAIAARTLGPTVLGGPKVISFDCNLAGCTECLTLDVHMYRIAGWPVTRSYEALTEAYRAAAARIGAKPSEFQATLWLFMRPPMPNDPDERLS